MAYREQDTVRNVPGVGEVAQIALDGLGIRTIGDLLRWYPRQYIDASAPTLLADLPLGELRAIKVSIKSIHSRRSKGRGVKMVEALAEDISGRITLRWFNQAYLEKKLIPGSEWVFIGVADRFQNQLTMLSPLIEEEARILSVYAQTKGINSKAFRTFIDWALKNVQEAGESLPSPLLEREGLTAYAEMLRRIHQPRSMEEVEQARRQIAFEEVFWFFIQLILSKEQQLMEPGILISADAEALKGAAARLPFELTPGQKRAVWDIAQEMASGQPMTRLLNGDVGSGKTMVAGLAALLVAKAGWRSILLVPTEILARQHAENLGRLLGPVGLKVAVWTAARKDELEEADLVVGTHAVLQEGFSFPRLGLVVIDEQHRFGVRQRAFLRAAQDRLPHVLSMTATPIPRTLALTLYGGLSVSVLSDKPKNRLPIITEVVGPDRRSHLHARVLAEIQAGHQVFVVCPLIEEKVSKAEAAEGPMLPLFNKEELGSQEKKTVVAEAERLQRDHPEYGTVGVIHGRMKAEEKKEVMERMAAGEINVLVATSVIEVGVDVPNATVMVIEGAERFGLAQLHQFRGRVGRGSEQAYCFLVPQVQARHIYERLQALAGTSSGFEVAEQDLALRGPGELVGQAQSGLPDFRMASLTDIEFLMKVRQIAEEYLADNPDFAERYREVLYSRFRGIVE